MVIGTAVTAPSICRCFLRRLHALVEATRAIAAVGSGVLLVELPPLEDEKRPWVGILGGDGNVPLLDTAVGRLRRYCPNGLRLADRHGRVMDQSGIRGRAGACE